MQVKKLLMALASAGLALLASASVQANTPSAVLTILQSDGTSWSEDVGAAGLINFDATTGNFTLLQGGSVGESHTTDNVDAWVWQIDTAGNGYWDWHSAETVSGSTVALGGSTTANDPWMSSFQLRSLSGHGDPDLSYGFYAKNNTSLVQNYLFSISETIVPMVSGANTVSAEIVGGLVTTDGAATITPLSGNAVQKFYLSGDNGATLVNAGVDVGPTFTTNTSTSYGPYSSAAISGPTGTWNFMQITTAFTLTGGKDVVSLAGSAQILPVPEADQYALLLAGLGLIGFVARRRAS